MRSAAATACTLLMGALLASCGPSRDVGEGTAAATDGAAVLARLPTIDFATQCPDSTACDHSVEAEVFGALDSLGASVLERNMSIERVRGVLGGAPHHYAEPLTFRDQRFGNQVTIWTYAVGLSGTDAYVLVFASGCLDFFGTAQVGTLYARYGRPGWTSDAVEDYRFTSAATSTCGTA